MSILGQSEGAATATFLGFFVLLAGSIAIAAFVGVFRPRSVEGPVRWRSDESTNLIFRIMLIGVIVWFGVQVFYALIRKVSSGAAADGTPAATQPAHLTSGELIGIVTVAPILAFIAMLLANRHFRRDGGELIGLNQRNLGRGILGGLMGITMVFVPILFFSMLTEVFWKAIHYTHPNEHELLKIFEESSSKIVRVLILFSAAVVAPFCEELLFRGYLQTGLSKLFSGWIGGRELLDEATPISTLPVAVLEPLPDGAVEGIPLAYATVKPKILYPTAFPRWLAIVLTSLVFAAVHPFWSAPPIFVLSLFLGYAYERTGNLWVNITMHAMFNSLQVLLFLSQNGGI